MDAVARLGFDVRLSHDTALYGRGIYLAESLDKAFMYTGKFFYYFVFAIGGFTYYFHFSISFLPRNAMLSTIYAIVVCLSVCGVSDTLRYCIKTAKHRIMQITPHDGPGTHAF